MAIKAGRSLVYIPTHNGDSGLVRALPEAAGQTFVKGDPVIVSSGQIAIAGSASAPLGDLVLLGVAEAPASGVTNALVPIRIFRPGDLFTAHFESDDTFATANFNAAGFDLKRGAAGSGILVVDQDTTTFPKVLVLKNAEVEAPTPAGGAVVVKIRHVAANIFYAN